MFGYPASIARVVGIHAEYELVILPLLQVIAFGGSLCN